MRANDTHNESQIEEVDDHVPVFYGARVSYKYGPENRAYLIAIQNSSETIHVEHPKTECSV